MPEIAVRRDDVPAVLRDIIEIGTLSLATGEDIRVVMANMGHSQISTTMLYTHVLPSLQRTAADNMEVLLGRPKSIACERRGW